MRSQQPNVFQTGTKSTIQVLGPLLVYNGIIFPPTVSYNVTPAGDHLLHPEIKLPNSTKPGKTGPHCVNEGNLAGNLSFVGKRRSSRGACIETGKQGVTGDGAQLVVCISIVK